MRAVAQARYLPTAVSDALIAVVNFSLIKHVAGAKTRTELVGYVIGGVVGSMAGIWISKRWFKA